MVIFANKLNMNKIRRINWLDMIVASPDETSLFYERVFGFVREPLQEDEDHISYFVKDGTESVVGICDAGVFPIGFPAAFPTLT